MKKVIFWDFDQTLVYRDGMWTQSLYQVLNNHGYENINSDIISRVFQSGFPWHRHKEAHSDYFDNQTWWQYVNTLIDQALIAVGITHVKAKHKLIQDFKDEYLRIGAWHLFDDTITVLEEAMRRNYGNIILSNHTPELKMLVTQLGIDDYFTHVISSATVGYEKPNPMIFKQAMQIANGDIFTMVGDSYNADILGATQLGLNAVLVRKENKHNYHQYAKTLDKIWQHLD